MKNNSQSQSCQDEQLDQVTGGNATDANMVLSMICPIATQLVQAGCQLAVMKALYGGGKGQSKAQQKALLENELRKTKILRDLPDMTPEGQAVLDKRIKSIQGNADILGVEMQIEALAPKPESLLTRAKTAVSGAATSAATTVRGAASSAADSISDWVHNMYNAHTSMGTPPWVKK